MGEKVVHQYQGILMDSQEEVWFAMWLQELLIAGYVTKWRKETIPILMTPEQDVFYTKRTQLKTKMKEERKKHIILRKLEYTPDFAIEWSNDGHKLFCTNILQNIFDRGFQTDKIFIGPAVELLVEVKPDFDKNNMERDFIVKQKVLFFYQKTFVNLIHTIELFEKTFMPKEAMEDFKYKKNTKNWKKGDWKVKYIPKTLEQFIQI